MADDASTGHPADPQGALPRRGRIARRGFVERVTIVPRNAAPHFTATVALTGDVHAARRPGTAPDTRIRLEWTGQRRIPGIDPGIDLAFEGMVSIVDGIPTIYNPRYEIIGRPEESP